MEQPKIRILDVGTKSTLKYVRASMSGKDNHVVFTEQILVDQAGQAKSLKRWKLRRA
jgi:hypothetical protein